MSSRRRATRHATPVIEHPAETRARARREQARIKASAITDTTMPATATAAPQRQQRPHSADPPGTHPAAPTTTPTPARTEAPRTARTGTTPPRTAAQPTTTAPPSNAEAADHATSSPPDSHPRASSDTGALDANALESESTGRATAGLSPRSPLPIPSTSPTNDETDHRTMPPPPPPTPEASSATSADTPLGPVGLVAPAGFDVVTDRAATGPLLPPEEYLTPAELVVELRGAVTEATLRNWRYRGTGPAALTIGRQVFYRRAVVRAWLESLETKSQRDHGWPA